jgi:hypothetical protein
MSWNLQMDKNNIMEIRLVAMEENAVALAH